MSSKHLENYLTWFDFVENKGSVFQQMIEKICYLSIVDMKLMKLINH